MRRGGLHRGVPIKTITSYESTIANCIDAALNLRRLYGQYLMQDREICNLFAELNLHIEATQEAMVRAGMVRECADCAVNGEGTCCAAYTGCKCGSVLLLINLLIGGNLPSAPAESNLCYFLTDHGCALRARHVICVNFLCKRLQDVIPHDLLCNVQEIAGREIDTLFVLEERIKGKIAILMSIGT